MSKQVVKRGAIKFRVEKVDGNPMWDAILVVNGKPYHGLASLPEVACDRLSCLLAEGDAGERLLSMLPVALWLEGEKEEVRRRFGVPHTSTDFVVVG